MATIQNLDQANVDPICTGMYIKVRATSPGKGTYYLRYKDGAGKTCLKRLGRTTDITLDGACKQAETLRAAITMRAAPTRRTSALADLPHCGQVASDVRHAVTLGNLSGAQQ